MLYKSSHLRCENENYIETSVHTHLLEKLKLKLLTIPRVNINCNNWNCCSLLKGMRAEGRMEKYLVTLVNLNTYLSHDLVSLPGNSATREVYGNTKEL